jgi:hypothetical protein
VEPATNTESDIDVASRITQDILKENQGDVVAAQVQGLRSMASTLGSKVFKFDDQSKGYD